MKVGSYPSRRRAPWVVTLLAAVVTFGLDADRSECSPLDQLPLEWVADTELHDVFFADPDSGWAVGDRGLILRSTDGGRTWGPVRSGVNCRLESVFFLDNQRGWICGGYASPSTHRSHGVVLTTEDGGVTWRSSKDHYLPWLRRIKFASPDLGIAIGDWSAFAPSGVYVSRNGGRSWAPMANDSQGHWTTGDWKTVDRVVVAGAPSQAAFLTPGGLATSQFTSGTPGTIRSLRMLDERSGWAVGDHGTVLTTRTGGLAWGAPHTLVPQEVQGEIDFQTVFALEDHCWIAGNPGGVIVRSRDQGRTWDSIRTGQGNPINAIHFVDRQRGWAVGALGTILSTRDGGTTWRIQRSGPTRTSVLVVSQTSDAIPWELLARLSASHRHIIAVHMIEPDGTHERPDPISRFIVAAKRDRIRQSANRVGVSCVTFSTAAPNDLSNGPPRSGADLAKLDEESLVRSLRQWKPNTLMLVKSDIDELTDVDDLFEQTVASAYAKAADPGHYSDQVIGAGLDPWTTPRLLVVSQERSAGDSSVSTTQFSPELGTTLDDYCLTSRWLVSSVYEPAPDAIFVRQLHPVRRTSASLDDLVETRPLSTHDRFMRAAGDLPASNMTTIRRLTERRKTVKQLTQIDTRHDALGQAWLSAVDSAVTELPFGSRPRFLFELSLAYQNAGRPEMAARGHHLLVDFHPESELVEGSLTWLLSFYASREIRWQTLKRTEEADTWPGEIFVNEEFTWADPEESNVPPTLSPIVDDPRNSTIATVGFDKPVEPSLDVPPTQYVEHARKLLQRIQQVAPDLSLEPAVQLVSRSISQPSPHNAEYRQLSLMFRPVQQPTQWNQIVASEKWLQDARNQPLGDWLFRCTRVAQKPFLNGKLDDSCWHQERTTQSLMFLPDIGTIQKPWPKTAIVSCFDDEYLYVALICQKSLASTYTDTDQPRPRDPDLQDRERVALVLDLDRDYHSAYTFEIDHRGWVRETLAEDFKWNPQWHVARAESDADWTIELAIPWQQIAPEPPLENDTWAIGFTRIVPGQGRQSWPGESPMGLFLFQN